MECSKWYLFRYLHPADQNLRRITKPDKDFAKRLNFKDVIFPVKIRDIHEIKKKKKRILSAIASLVMKTTTKKSIYVSKNALKKNLVICHW